MKHHRGGTQMARNKKQIYEDFQASKPTNFMVIYWDMYDSKAWSELTAKDIQLYMHMLRKYHRKVTSGMIYDSNKDNISVTETTTKNSIGYSEFMAKETFWKSIDHLIELGFIKLIRNGYSTRQCNIYGFSDMWQKYGTKEFHIKPEWLRMKSQQIKAKNTKNVK